jgi:hypothetical protein
LKDCTKERETGDFTYIDLYKMEMTPENEEEDQVNKMKG